MEFLTDGSLNWLCKPIKTLLNEIEKLSQLTSLVPGQYRRSENQRYRISSLLRIINNQSACSYLLAFLASTEDQGISFKWVLFWDAAICQRPCLVPGQDRRSANQHPKIMQTILGWTREISKFINSLVPSVQEIQGILQTHQHPKCAQRFMMVGDLQSAPSKCTQQVHYVQLKCQLLSGCLVAIAFLGLSSC